MLFNAHAGELWRRFTTYLPRHLARLTGMTQKALRASVRVRYVKVAEYQARGVVHYHAVIRLDAAAEDYQPPPAPFTAGLLHDAIDQAAAAVALPVDADPDGPPVVLRFGAQVDVKPIRPGDDLPGTGRQLSHAGGRRTTSPSTPPRPSTPPACPTGPSPPAWTSTRCAARPTTGA